MTSGKLLSFLKSLTIVFPLIIGLIRFNTIDKSYRPIIVYIMVGFITEITSFISIQLYKSNIVVSNVFSLAEWLLIVWQFVAWGFFTKSKKGLGALCLVVVMVWVTENIVFQNLNKNFSPYFSVLYYFIIVLMSVNIINYTIIYENKNLFRNARFLICLSFIIFFIYRLLFDWAWQYSQKMGYKDFNNLLTASFGYVNMLENVIFAFAILFFPTRKSLQ
jgi:hypothetical protein